MGGLFVVVMGGSVLIYLGFFPTFFARISFTAPPNVLSISPVVLPAGSHDWVAPLVKQSSEAHPSPTVNSILQFDRNEDSAPPLLETGDLPLPRPTPGGEVFKKVNFFLPAFCTEGFSNFAPSLLAVCSMTHGVGRVLVRQRFWLKATLFFLFLIQICVNSKIVSIRIGKQAKERWVC